MTHRLRPQTRKNLSGSRDDMGETWVTALIRNPAEPDRAWEGSFLADTGAIDCLVPRPYLESIGLGAEGQRIYTLADGSEITMDITGARIEFMGELVWATIVMADAGADPLLGMTALESAGIGVEPLNETLRKLSSTGLRGLGNSGR